MRPLSQGQPSETEAERLQRVERFLHSSTSWEPATPPPADLCARVADRIAGHSARPGKRKLHLSSVSYGFIASGACAMIALAVVLTGRLAPLSVPPASDHTIQNQVPTWTPPRLSRATGTGPSNSRALATYHEKQGTPTQPAEVPFLSTERNNVSPRRRPHLPRKRRYLVYATQTRKHSSALSTPEARPQTLAEGPVQEEWGPQDDMVALVPVVLADYEPDPNGDGSSESLQATYTPAVVAISLKQDALGEPSSQPLSKPEASAPETTPTPEMPPVPEASPTPDATGEPK